MVKKPTKAKAKTKALVLAPRVPKRTPEQRKAKAVELMLIAVAGGWTLVRFARLSGVSKSSLMRWVAEPTIQPRYFEAMRTKAISLPDEALAVVELLKAGGRWVTIPDEGKPGEFKKVWRAVDPKALGPVLRHYEFRMQREIKALYQREDKVVNERASDLNDKQLDDKINGLIEKAVAARAKG